MKYILAKSAAEALEALLAEEGKARIIASGSDVMVDMEAGKLSPQTLVDITTADDMKGIRIQDDQLIRQYFPSLCKGAGSVGSLQIRNSATLVGNVVTAMVKVTDGVFQWVRITMGLSASAQRELLRQKNGSKTKL